MSNIPTEGSVSPWRRRNLTIVGERNSGKTSFALLYGRIGGAVISSDAVKYDTEDPDGAITTVREVQPTEEEFHQFVLPRRSLYVITINLTTLTGDGSQSANTLGCLKRWLTMIYTQTSNSKHRNGASLILAGTHAKGLSRSTLKAISNTITNAGSNLTAWKNLRKCNTPVDLCFFPVDHTDGADSSGMIAIRRAIDEALNTSMDAAMGVPQAWVEAADHLRANLADWTSLTEFTRVCATRYNMGPSDVTSLLAFLHDQGVVLWYDQPHKREVVLIDPATSLVPRLLGLKFPFSAADGTDVMDPLAIAAEGGSSNERLRSVGLNIAVLATLLAQKGHHIPASPVTGLLLPLPYLYGPATEADWQRSQWPTEGGTSIYIITTGREMLYYNACLGAADLKSEGFLPVGLYNFLFLEALKWATLQQPLSDGTLTDVVLCQDMAVLYFKQQRFRVAYCAAQNFLRLDVESTNPLSLQRKLLNSFGQALRGVMNHVTFFTAVLYNHAMTNTAAEISAEALAAARVLLAPTSRVALVEGEVLIPMVKLHRSVQSHNPIRANNRQRLLEENGVRQIYRQHLQLLPTLQLYDVFISYRWNHSDYQFAGELFEAFGNVTVQTDDRPESARAVEVFHDWRRVDVGPGFIPDFSQAVPHSLIGLPLVTVDALERMLTHIPSAIDNVLLEWTLMLECFHAKRLRRIFPVLMGARDEALTAGVKDFLNDPSLRDLPNVVPTATLAQAAKILRDGRVIVSPAFSTRTVASIVQEMLQFESCNAAYLDRFEVQDHICERVAQQLEEIFAQDRSDDIPALVARALRRGSKEWRRSKLSVVGEGRAGKTALTNAIIGRMFEDTDSTIGINQLTCDVKHVKATVSSGGDSELGSAGVGGELRWSECRREDRELESALAESVAVLKLKRARGESDGTAGNGSDILSLLMAAKAAAGSAMAALTGGNAVVSAGGSQTGTGGTGVGAGGQVGTTRTARGAGRGGSSGSSSPASGQASPPLSGSLSAMTGVTSPAASTVVSPADRPLDEDMVMRALATITDAETGLLISLFDFGGQSVFDVIHHLFLTRNGVYALVFNMEGLLPSTGSTSAQCDSERALRLLQRWLSSVAVHTFDTSTQRTAPIVFVGTRLDRVATAAEHTQISRLLYDTFSDHPAWPSVIENTHDQDGTVQDGLWFFPVSNPAGSGCPAMRRLMNTVHQAMDKAAYTHKEVPLTWFKVIDQMRDTEQDCLPLSEVIAISARCNVSEQEVPYLLTFLHDMGHLMWLDEPELRDVVILDAVKYLVTPATVIICNIAPVAGDGVQHILPAHRECAHQCKDEWNALRREGVLHVKLLPILWKEYAARTDTLLLLMVKYGLLVPLRPARISRSGIKAGASAAPTAGLAASATVDAPTLYIVPALLVPAPLHTAHGVYDWTDQPVSSVYFVFTLSEDKLQSYCAITAQDLRTEGFLPGGMFERIVGKALSWSQDTAKGGRLNLRSVILHKDVAVLTFGRQRFRLVHCPDLHAVRVDIEGTHPIGVQQKLQVLVDKIIAECLPFLRWFPALCCSANAPVSATTSSGATETEDANYEAPLDPLHKRLAPGEVLLPLQQVRDAALGQSVLTWRGGRPILSEDQVRERYGPWLQIYGLRAQYDVFISYRWGTYDSPFTEQLFDMFTNYTIGTANRAIEVFLDVKCLQKGQLFKSDFAAALTHCHVALPILSVDALQRMGTHRAEDVDNVLLEWVIILECFAAKRLRKVFPIVFGERTKAGVAGSRLSVADYFADARVSALPTTTPTATLEKATELLRANGIEPSARMAAYTVRSIVHQLPEFLLCKAHDYDALDLVEAYVNEVVHLLRQCGADRCSMVPGPPTVSSAQATVPAIALVGGGNSGAFPVVNGSATVSLVPPLPVPTIAPNTAALATTSPPPSAAAAVATVVPVAEGVKQLKELTVNEVCTLVTQLGLPEVSAVFAQLQVTGAKLCFCRAASNLQTRYFGIDEEFVAEGLFEQIQDWKVNGVSGI